MGDLGDRTNPSPAEGNEPGESRRDFLKKAVALGLAAPAAGALASSAGARPNIFVSERARPFEGVTLQFAKAPFGTDEKEVIAKLLKPFTAKTGIKIQHTIVPWNTEGAAYATNYAGPNPFDVSYQTSTDLTSLGTKGVLEVLNNKQWLYSPQYAATAAKFIPNTIKKSTYQGKLYGLPCIIGGTVMFYNKDLLAKAGITKVPTNSTELAAAARKVADAPDVWGFSVPMTDKDFTWYFHYVNIHNRGGDIISKDGKRATFLTAPVIEATQASVDLILKDKVQPPVGQYDREAGVALFKGGRIAFLQDEPLRLAVFRKEGLPFKWDFVNPVGAPGGKRTIFSTTGHWVMAAKGKNQDAAWEFVKFLSSPAFANEFGAHYGWAPVRKDVNTSKGDAQVQRINKYVLSGWDGLPTGPKMAQLASIYGQAIEAAATGNKSVKAALTKAQADATRILKS
ncbi:MAG: sugar ABC transporter substrate-binding protein [Acidobacteria bacterium]|nr:sugar ABC transporter substrate-binding protein [Acidobacteriota bacterium]